MKRVLNLLFAAALFSAGCWFGRQGGEVSPAAATADEAPVNAAQSAPTATADLKPEDGLQAAFGTADEAEIKRRADKLNETDPLATLRLLISSKAGASQTKLFAAAFQALAGRDLEVALGFYHDHPELRLMLDLQEALTFAGMKLGAKAWQVIQQHRQEVGIEGLKAVAEGWARRDALQAVAAGLAITDGLDRAAFLEVVFARWSENDAKGFMAWLKMQPQEQVTPYISRLKLWDAKKMDWQTLRDLAMTMPSSVLQRSGWQSAIEKALQNPQELRSAPAWIRTLPDPSVRDDAWRAYASALLKQGRGAEIEAVLKELSQPDQTTAFTSMIAVGKALQDPLAGMKYADSLGDARAAEMARYSVFGTWMQRDQNGAIAWLKSQFTSLSQDQRRTLMGQWDDKQPAEAMSWLVLQGDSADNLSLLKNALRSYYDTKPDQVLSWLSVQPSGPVRDTAATAMADRSVRGPEMDFSAAMQFAGQASPGQPRADLALKVLSRWRQIDVKAAQAWLTSAQASTLLGADGLVKGQAVLAKPALDIPKVSNLSVADDLGTWNALRTGQESWELGGQRVEVYW